MVLDTPPQPDDNDEDEEEDEAELLHVNPSTVINSELQAPDMAAMRRDPEKRLPCPKCGTGMTVRDDKYDCPKCGTWYYQISFRKREVRIVKDDKAQRRNVS